MAVALSLSLSAVSTGIERWVVAVHPTVMGCEDGCGVVAAGWPVPFVVDDPALSPVHSVSLIGVLDGTDEVRWSSLAVTLGFWLAVGVVVSEFAWRAVGRTRTWRNESGERDG